MPLIIVSWLMEFLTFGYKISLVVSIKLMGFKEIAVFCELHPQTHVSSLEDSSVWIKKIEFAAPECSS